MPRESTHKRSKKKETPKKGKDAEVAKKPKKQPKFGAQSPYIIAAIALAALVIGIGIGYVVMGTSQESASGPEEPKAIILFDDKCSVCNSELNQVISYLDKTMKFNSLPKEYISIDSEEGKEIYKKLVENNVNYVPLIAFKGDITNTEFYKEFNRQTAQAGGATRYIQKAGEYYVIKPVWTVRIYDPNKPGEKLVVYVSKDVSKDAVERLAYRIIPNADLEIREANDDYMLKFEAPVSALAILKQIFPISEVDGNSLTVPYVNTSISAQKDFLNGIVQSIQQLAPNIKITSTSQLDANSPYLAVVETDKPSLLETLLSGWERDGNRFVAMKTDKPKVELFVMSYCPYGLQTEKAIIPVLDLLGDRIDFKLRFVNYAMHGEKEVWENLRQYCIQFKTNPEKFIDYLRCFTKNGDAEKCMAELNIDANAVQNCVDEEDKKYGITQILENPAAWGSQFPPFPIDDALNKQYGVRGSPTLVINGIVAPTPRNPEDLKNLICEAFLHPPEECSETLSSENESPGFGGGTASIASAGQCG